MNYTEQELEISNKSYTNKDFNTIYPELLDLVKKLTNKWDPTTSNESDPGVVLLKLWSILADKNNYNIDKNILETFPLSVTQRGNAQRLYDMLGYDMHYYRSATTNVTMYYVGEDLGTEAGKTNKITVPKFTMLTDDTGSNVFTLLEDLTFSYKATPETKPAIQGTIHDYEVNGVTDITLDNLDSEYRVFFTESRIAENGIFITNKGEGNEFLTDQWKRVSNLESSQLGNKVYKFGVIPNTQTCYIQFPQDIGNLIGNGLNIKYIITDGVNGNIQANQLTTFRNDVKFSLGSTYKSLNNDVTIRNFAATTNGADPEDLDSAYKNYKKTIGTFNTLLTTEDYEKAIYSLYDSYGQAYASNVVASDRTNDINYSANVITLNNGYIENQLSVDQESISEEVSVTNPTTGDLVQTTYTYKKDKMSAFDLGLYVLSPMINVNDETGYYYNKSFSVNSDYDNIIAQLEDQKASHYDYLQLKGGVRDYIKHPISSEDIGDLLPFIFKNFYTLNGKVLTYYKVTEEEAKEIEKNIKLALFRDYNAREVEFGSPILYEDIINTIEKSDTRIKAVVLNEPEYKLYYMNGADFTGSRDTAHPMPNPNDNHSTKEFVQALMYKLLLKMIVSGHVQLFDFNKDIKFDFGQTNLKKYSNITSITTSVSIPKEDVGNGYEIKKNQTVQLYAPNFYTKKMYSAYVNYKFEGTLVTNGLSKNTYYKLGAGDKIKLEYTDANGVSVPDEISEGSWVRFVDNSGTLNKLEYNSSVNVIEKTINGETLSYNTLTASQQIELLDINKVEFPTNNENYLYCLWFTNDVITVSNNDNTTTQKYVLFKSGEKEKILQQNEYFIYTNTLKNELVILGSGTMLVRNTDADSAEIAYESKVPASAIVEKGQQAISDTDWYRYSLIGGKELSIVELQIVNLGEGALINGTPENNIGNSPTKINEPKYKEKVGDASWIQLDTYSNDSATSNIDMYWKIVSKLNILTNTSKEQTLATGENIKLNNNDELNTPGLTIMSNSLLAFGGGSNISVSRQDNESINIYTYEKATMPSFTDNDGTTYTFERSAEDGVLKIPYQKYRLYKQKQSPSPDCIKFNISFDNTITGTLLIPIYLLGNNIEVTIDLCNFNDESQVEESLIEEEIKINPENPKEYLEYENLSSISYLKLQLTKTSSSSVDEDKINDVVCIGYPYIYTDYGDQLLTTLDTIFTEDINNIDTKGLILESYPEFDLTYQIKSEDAIDTDVGNSSNKNNLFAGDVIWDKNHICNKFTIAQWDSKNSSIKVAPSNIKK